MNDVASLGLCKELYEVSGWTGTFNFWEQSDGVPSGEPYLIQPELMRRYGLWGTQEVKKRWPAYDLGYLLRKLPERDKDIRNTVMLGRATGNQGWSCIYRDFAGLGDTPEDAAAKLAIELFKQKILQKETS